MPRWPGMLLNTLQPPGAPSKNRLAPSVQSSGCQVLVQGAPSAAAAFPNPQGRRLRGCSVVLRDGGARSHPGSARRRQRRHVEGARGRARQQPAQARTSLHGVPSDGGPEGSTGWRP